MKTGYVRAYYVGSSKRFTVHGIDSFELTTQAISGILNRAKTDPVWAKGKIILKDETGRTLHEMAAKNPMKPLIGKHTTIDDEQYFKSIFNVDLNYFMHPVTGFDIFKFDKFIRTPDGKSCNDWLKEKYGEQAKAFIVGILKRERKRKKRLLVSKNPIDTQSILAKIIEMVNRSGRCEKGFLIRADATKYGRDYVLNHIQSGHYGKIAQKTFSAWKHYYYKPAVNPYEHSSYSSRFVAGKTNVLLQGGKIGKVLAVNETVDGYDILVVRLTSGRIVTVTENKVVSIQNPAAQRGYSNPAKRVKIYDKIISITARKGRDSNFANLPFTHDFSKKHKAQIYGLPDGSIQIKGTKPLWKNFQYKEN